MSAALHQLDYLAIAIYLLLMAGIGFFFKWFVKDIHAYTKGSNTIPWVAAGISNFMAMFSTFVFVAYAGVAFEHGLVSVTVFWSTIPACLVYDITFRAPRIDAQGQLKAAPRITVNHNGVLIHQELELPYSANALKQRRSKPASRKPGRIKLQDHGYPVSYRNIWIVEQ